MFNLSERLTGNWISLRLMVWATYSKKIKKVPKQSMYGPGIIQRPAKNTIIQYITANTILNTWNNLHRVDES